MLTFFLLVKTQQSPEGLLRHLTHFHPQAWFCWVSAGGWREKPRAALGRSPTASPHMCGQWANPEPQLAPERVGQLRSARWLCTAVRCQALTHRWEGN